MRALLDEDLPRRLKRHFPADVEVLTVQERGWSGIKNSALLRLAAGAFEVFLTMGRGAEFQQNLQSLSRSQAARSWPPRTSAGRRVPPGSEGVTGHGD
jgi:hypothetical protein